MKVFTNPDLFPETLLVSREGDRIYTTSLKVAEHFAKRHDHILRGIRNLLSDLASVPNFGAATGIFFEEGTYLDAQKKPRKLFKLSHDAFLLVTMSLTGAEALALKVDFIRAFREQERVIADLTNRFAHVTDIIRPSLRPTVEGTEAGQDRATIAIRLGKSPGSVTYHRRQARRFGLL